MKYISLILLIMTMLSCKEKKHIYVYGSSEFNEKSALLKYDLNEALEIYCNYLFKTTQKDSLRFYIRIIYDNNYVFSKIPYDDKMGYCYLDGYWINGDTGEINEMNTGEYLKIKLEKYAPAIRITKEEFYGNKENLFKNMNESS